MRRHACSGLHWNNIISGRISASPKGHIKILSDNPVGGSTVNFCILSNETIVPVSFSPFVRNFCNLLFCCLEVTSVNPQYLLPPGHVETASSITKLSPFAANFKALQIDVFSYFPIDISSLVNVIANGSYFNPKVVLKISDSFSKFILPPSYI